MWVRGISGGLSVMIVAQYLSLWDWLEHIQLQKGEEDKVVWKWSENGIYSAKTAYRALHLGSQRFLDHRLELLAPAASQDLLMACSPASALDRG